MLALKQLHNKKSNFNKLTRDIVMKLTNSMFQSAISLFSCILYVVSTYYGEENEEMFDLPEFTLAILFSLDYIIGFVNARDKKKFITNPFNVLDLATILPIFLNYLAFNEDEKIKFSYTRLLRIMRVIRILRLYRLFKVDYM
jgi:energy-coupling factor transporter transmembrane protein EcfT